MNNNRTSKIETLKRKSRRKHLINELSYMTLSEHPFLNTEENQLFCQKVFVFLQSREHKIQIHGEHYQEHIEKSVQMLKELVSWVKVASAQARFMCFREHEIEAVEVNVNEVFIHLNRLLEQTKLDII
ncbi:hypothetical protein B4134_3793 [Bacillus safensis]|uniref:YxiF family protein n=1 Tax=Bacillus safensis TaxID=561879 RepID=UPI0005ADD981|nr:hypothetical protein [Bacillus safensis]KIL20297.1 hypothetical protein B4134_3793 [Bacillus safensis]MED5222795.1 hypothetical protein [Bacillus safensis]